MKVPRPSRVPPQAIELRTNSRFQNLLTRLETNPNELDGYTFVSDYEMQRTLETFVKKIGETRTDSIKPQLIP